jgi:hypothetical protein
LAGLLMWTAGAKIASCFPLWKMVTQFYNK